MMAGLIKAVKIVKYSLYLLTIFCVLLGITLLAAGERYGNKHHEFEVFLKSNHLEPSIVLASMGIGLIVTSLCSFTGLATKNRFMLHIYAIALLIFALFETVVILYTLLRQSEISEYVKYRMTDALESYKELDKAKNGWDRIQKELHCCGVTHALDWAPVGVNGCLVEDNGFSFTVPYSCTKNGSINCENIYERGCFATLDNMFSGSFIFIAAGIMTIFVVQIGQVFLIYVYSILMKHYEGRLDAREREEYERLLPTDTNERTTYSTNI